MSSESKNQKLVSILVVEDDEGLRDFLRMTLEARGYSVQVASNGADAIATVKTMEAKPRLMITDIMMPQMNGVDLVRQLHEDFPEIRALFLSGSMDYDHEIVETGAPLIEKPFTEASLVTRVRQALDC